MQGREYGSYAARDREYPALRVRNRGCSWGLQSLPERSTAPRVLADCFSELAGVSRKSTESKRTHDEPRRSGARERPGKTGRRPSVKSPPETAAASGAWSPCPRARGAAGDADHC